MNQRPNTPMNQEPQTGKYIRAFAPGTIEEGAQDRINYLWERRDTRRADAMAMCKEWLLEDVT